MPEIRDLEEDERGRLWVLIKAASDRWAEAVVKAPAGAHPEEGEYTLRHGVRAYDWILEVIDPREDRVVARKKLDWIPLALLDGGLPYPLVRI